MLSYTLFELCVLCGVIHQLLKRPYMLDSALRSYLRRGWMFGFFVFAFLVFFRPFGLDSLPSGIVPMALGYGLITFLVIVAIGLAMRMLPGNYYSESHWTVGREILWTTVHVALIGLANLLYSHALGFIDLSWRGLLQFELYTMAVGLFPITLLVLLNEARLSRRFAESSAQINSDLRSGSESAPDSVQVFIPSENQTEDLRLPADAILLIRSADNYAEVIIGPTPAGRHVLRTTLKAAETALSGHDQFLRCHKGFIVNLHHVEAVSGNAQGYKLHLRGLEEPVPVSRQRNQLLRERLAIRP